MALFHISENLNPFRNKIVILSDRFIGMAVVLLFITIHLLYAFQHLHFVIIGHLLIWLYMCLAKCCRHCRLFS